MKPDYKHLLLSAAFAAVWGYFADLRYGNVDGFILRIIIILIVSYLFDLISQKFFNNRF